MSTNEEKGPESGPDQYKDAWDALKPGLQLTRLSDDELRKFVREYLAGEIYTSDNVRNQNDITLVFLPAAMGAFSQYNPDSLNDIGILWEYMNKALPRGINGMPMFMSLHVMHRLDWAKARKMIVREEERLKEMAVPPDDPEP